MHLYNLTLQTPTAVTQAVLGSFTVEKTQQIILAKGNYLEMLSVDVETGKMEQILELAVNGVVRSMSVFRVPGGSKDYLIVGSDSGRLVILEYNQEEKEFVRVHMETFGKSGVRRIVPGEYLASDPKGRAVMIGALEKQKFVYILNRDASTRLTISSPLEAHRVNTITYSLIGVDVGFDNPRFAALEEEYQDVKKLVFYELDLGLNHVVRKWAEKVDQTSHLLIQVPGGVDGPSGVLLCLEDSLVWKNMNYNEVKIQKKKSIITCGTTHKLKKRFFILVQTDDGDLFRVVLDHDGEKVNKMNIFYFDTVDPATSILVHRSGYLFVASEFGDHKLYSIDSLLLEKNLTQLDYLESTSTLLDAMFVKETLYCLSGINNESCLKIFQHGLQVQEVARVEMEGLKEIWTIDNLIIVSFDHSTSVFRVLQEIEEVFDTGIQLNTRSILVSSFGEDYIQITNMGIRHIKNDKVFEFKLTGITYATANQRQVMIALGNELRYFELESGFLNEFPEHKKMTHDVCCLDIMPTKLKRTKFMAVGTLDNVIRVLNLDPLNCLEIISMQSLNAKPVSLCWLDSNLNIGLENGVWIKSNFNGELTDSRLRFLGPKPIILKRCLINSDLGFVVLGSRVWLNYQFMKKQRMDPLIYEPLIGISNFKNGFIGITNDSIRILNTSMGKTFSTTKLPLLNPKKFLQTPSKTLVILETDYKTSRIRILNNFKQVEILEINEACYSIAIVQFPITLNQEYYLVVGSTPNFSFDSNNGFIQLFLFQNDFQNLSFVHKTKVPGIALAFSQFQGRLAAGVGNLIRIYDLGLKQLLLKTENKQLPNQINFIQSQGNRMYVSDVQHSVHIITYRYQNNTLYVFADDYISRFMTCTLVLDFDTVLGGDKFGNLFVMRVSSFVSQEIELDQTGNSLMAEKNFINGAPYKLEHIAEFHVGDFITMIQKQSLIPGGREVIIYTTLQGKIGCLIPFSLKEDVVFMQMLEMHMKQENILGRVNFRSLYSPVRNVVDGDLCESYNCLDSEKQQQIANEMDKTVNEISSKLNDLRFRSAF